MMAIMALAISSRSLTHDLPFFTLNSPKASRQIAEIVVPLAHLWRGLQTPAVPTNKVILSTQILALQRKVPKMYVYKHPPMPAWKEETPLHASQQPPLLLLMRMMTQQIATVRTTPLLP